MGVENGESVPILQLEKPYDEQQADGVIAHLKNTEVYTELPGIEVISIRKEEQTLPPLQIAWKIDENNALLLHLEPRRIGEGAIEGYEGYYGSATRSDDGWKFIEGDKRRLEEVFGAPENIQLLIRPTVDGWSIGRDTLAVIEERFAVYGLQMGLGFLLLGPQWLLIGMHELGHIFPQPNETDDEREAWLQALRYYAKLHKGIRDQILDGANPGLFNLLVRKEKREENAPTIGDIVRLGMVSHFRGSQPGLLIPPSWRENADNTLVELTKITQRARQAYMDVFGF